MDSIRPTGIPIAKSWGFPEDGDIWGRFSDNATADSTGGGGGGGGCCGEKEGEKRQEAKESGVRGHPVLKWGRWVMKR